MFNYLGVLLSVILGLALTHLLFGVARVIEMRATVRPYWVQVVWAANVLMFVLAVWWGMFFWHQLAEWHFDKFLYLVAYAIVLFMFAAVLFPTSLPEQFDPEEYFFANRRWFFGLFALALLLDVPETLTKQVAGLRSMPVEYKVLIPFSLTLAVTGYLSSNRRVHGVIAIAFLLAMIAYETLTSLNRIVASVG